MAHFEVVSELCRDCGCAVHLDSVPFCSCPDDSYRCSLIASFLTKLFTDEAPVQLRPAVVHWPLSSACCRCPALRPVDRTDA